MQTITKAKVKKKAIYFLILGTVTGFICACILAAIISSAFRMLC